MTTTYQPKGGQCQTCSFWDRDYSGKDFSKMRPADKDGKTIIVICSDYMRI